MSLLSRRLKPWQRNGRSHVIRTAHHRNVSTRTKLFTVAEEVEDALATGKPVVALETTIYTHGYPYPENVALASRLESLVRINGGVPATIGIVEGRAHVGMSPDVLIQLISTAGNKTTRKISRRDLAFIGGLGLRGQKLNGGTTIAGTMILAHLAGIKVFATGGLGGVHRNGENSMDISADLTELGRTPVAVIASGCKSFLDIPRTLEYLETQGVGVGTFADGRPGNVDFPAFFSRNSGVTSPQTIENEADAAAIIHAQFTLPVQSGLLFANPVPTDAAMKRHDIDGIIAQAVAEAEEKGITGSANTPYILKRIRELSEGRSVVANRALIENNVIVGTKVAVELAKLELQDEGGASHGTGRRNSYHIPALTNEPSNQKKSSINSDSISTASTLEGSNVQDRSNLLVIGSLASDTMCDFVPIKSAVSPTLQTSNPATIAQSMGGVGCNVAVAAHYAGARVSLASFVADDIAGNSLIDQTKKLGLDASQVRQLRTSDGAYTAQYVAFNDANKELVVAMADMAIFTRPEFEDPQYWSATIDHTNPKWIVVDGNWSAQILATILKCAKQAGVSIAFEPVSVVKAARFFDALNLSKADAAVVPDNITNIATPNVFELAGMHKRAQELGFFESEEWWSRINSFGLSSGGSRDKFTMITGADLVDRGVPQQTIQLLPYIPNIITKLGSKGVLLTSLLKPDDARLRDEKFRPYILAGNDEGHDVVGGVYMRLFPPPESINKDEIVNVNGVGDTLLGVLMAGLVNDKMGNRPFEELLCVAQRAAGLTLRSEKAVSPAIATMEL